MTEKSRFFRSEQGDRKYTADEFAEYFRTLIDGGVWGDQLNALQVTADGGGMYVYVDTGRAFIEGYYYENDAQMQLTIDAADPTNPRIDRVVLRLDRATNRAIQAVVKKGTPAASPIPPDLTRDLAGSGIYEISLAKVYVDAGTGVIATDKVTDERSDETVCGYVRYQAKPAWYPGGDIPQDAWVYTIFKDKLTAQEIEDIEANQSLMDIINSSELIRLKIALSFKSAFNSGYDGDVTISSDVSMPREIMYYNNLTIDTGATLYTPGSFGVVCVAGTLTLNGSISATGKGAPARSGSNGGGDSGAGGGVLIVIANRITGAGTIEANGTNGTDGSSVTGSGNQVSGIDACFAGFVVNGATNHNKGTVNGNAYKFFEYISPINDIAPANYMGGASGSSGQADNTDTYHGYGGGGGAGVVGDGGDGGRSYAIPDHLASGGGGGGGGGAVLLFSANAVPAITVTAKGGNGGNGWLDGAGNGGGGGGGGLVVITAPSSSATVDVSPGDGGIGPDAAMYGDANYCNGDSGDAGVSMFFKI